MILLSYPRQYLLNKFQKKLYGNKKIYVLVFCNWSSFCQTTIKKFLIILLTKIHCLAITQVVIVVIHWNHMIKINTTLQMDLTSKIICWEAQARTKPWGSFVASHLKETTDWNFTHWNSWGNEVGRYYNSTVSVSYISFG